MKTHLEVKYFHPPRTTAACGQLVSLFDLRKAPTSVTCLKCQRTPAWIFLAKREARRRG